MGVFGRGRKEKLDTIPTQGEYQPTNPGVYQDMNLPLCDYHISSGHNSYLSGNQLTSKSSTAIIVYAISHGCRVIELDVWNGKKGPKVLHGGTLTKSVSFEACIHAVNEAFDTQQYPLVLTIENHCSKENMKVMAETLQRILGDKLLVPDWDALTATTWHTPEQLRGKVLIRDKSRVDGEGDDDDDDDANDVAAGLSKKQKAKLKKKATRAALREKKEEVKEAKTQRNMAKGTSRFGGNMNKSKQTVIDFVGFQQLIAMVNVKHHKATESEYVVSSSRGEGKFDKIKKEGPDFLKHTQKHIVRTYPGPTRVDSSNYNPTQCWNFGAQVVALNWQTSEKEMWVYQARFRDNGGCGYILKPDWQLGDTVPHIEAMQPGRKLKVTVLALRDMHLSTTMDNYVVVEVHGLPQDNKTDSKAGRTEVVQAKNHCTFKTKNSFEFPMSCEESATLLFILMDEDLLSADDFFGQYGVPVRGLAEGTWEFPLLDKSGNYYKKRGKDRRVVVKIQWEDL